MKADTTRDMKTHFIWEGVTSYLTAEAVDETLTFVAGNLVENSSIVFTYAYKSPADGVMFRGEKWWRMAYLERRGEPHIFGIVEGTIDGFLSARGFRLIENVCGKDAITATILKRWLGEG